LFNRKHTLDDFERAIKLTQLRKGVKIASHVILGLPGESDADIFATAKYVGKQNLDGIKIHPLYVVKGTK
jgi:uncharacterized protein